MTVGAPPEPPNDGDLNSGNGEEPPRGTRADQIFAAFVVFHITNRHIYRLVEKFTFNRIYRGFKNYGIGAVIEAIRWHVDVPTESEDGLKIRNDFRAYYARLFHVGHPEWKGFFRCRVLRSKNKPAFKHDLPPQIDPDDLGGDDLDDKLRDLL